MQETLEGTYVFVAEQRYHLGHGSLQKHSKQNKRAYFQLFYFFDDQKKKKTVSKVDK